MANISFRVHGDSAEIIVQEFDWTSMVVNGVPVAGIKGQGKGFDFDYQGSLPALFVITSSTDAVVGNSSQTLHMRGREGSKRNYTLQIQYDKADGVLTVGGTLTTMEVPYKGAEKGPIKFTQGSLAGVLRLQE
jgi:hypothetical protein